METYTECIMVTDWEKADKDDFYLSEEWAENAGGRMAEARELAKNGHLFIAYIVPAVHYAIYTQMDATQIFINEHGEEIMSCEGEIIGNNHKHREAYSY